MTTTIFHNPKCGTSRKVLAAAEERGVDVQIVKYLEDPPDRDALESLVARLEDPVADLVRKDAHFKELGLDPDAYTDVQSVVDLLVEHPRLMQRPLLLRDDRVVIARPVERAEAFFDR